MSNLGRVDVIEYPDRHIDNNITSGDLGVTPIGTSDSSEWF